MEDILNFEKKYKGTEEERHDVCRLYVQFEGDMDQIMGSALCCTHEDEPRIAAIIQGAIDAGDVPTFRIFTHESDKKKKSRKRRVRRPPAPYLMNVWGSWCTTSPNLGSH